jgi:hypothetical protein
MLREGLPARLAKREALGEKIVKAGNPRRKCFRFDRLERKDHARHLQQLRHECQRFVVGQHY